MTAIAEAAQARADAIVGAASSTDAFGFGTARATSSAALTGTTKGVADAQSLASNLNFAAGLITIGSVTSEAHGLTDGKAASSTGTTTVHDMKVRDIPVYVDDKGVHAGTTTVPNGPATAIANQLLASFGYTVYLTKPTTTTQGGTTKYDAGSLIVVWDTDTAHPGTKDIYFVFGGATIGAAAQVPFDVSSSVAAGSLSDGSSLAPTSSDGSPLPAAPSGGVSVASAPVATGSAAPVLAA